MKVQGYSDEDYARLFISDDLTIDLKRPDLCLIGLEHTECLKIIDKMMHQLSFYRREKWEKTDWGWQAKIRRRKYEKDKT